MNYIKNINKYLIYLVFALVSTGIGYGQCSVNAGGGVTTCGTTHNLVGVAGGESTNISWTLVTKPTGATDPIITGATTLTPTVSGMNTPGDYKFRLSKKCDDGKTIVTSEVTITSSGDVSSFSAGSDIVNVPATVGTVDLNGVIPAGFTGVWRSENIYEWERFGRRNSSNGQLSSTNTSNPTFSLIKKVDHDVDPAYRLYLKITSLYNPNCTYEKSIIVRFIPNPKILFPLEQSDCSESMDAISDYEMLPNSPFFDTFQKNASGNSAFGTSIVLNIISTPAGGSIQYVAIDTKKLALKTTVIGAYKFTLTIKNVTGEYTTPVLTYIRQGIKPGYINFIDPAHPEQKAQYAGGGSGGEVQCDMVGKSTPITIFYSINAKDDYTLVTSTTTADANYQPEGVAPTLQMIGAGQAKRSIIVTPPIGGWRVGTYPISISLKNGSCGTALTYYIHISDSKRIDLSIEDVVVCYPGSGTVEALVQLPLPFQETINSSYFQDYYGNYDISLVTGPMGASEPDFESDIWNKRTLKSTSTVISNLDTPGEYVFSIKAKGYIEEVDWLVAQEYACSGASRETTFKVIVSEQVGSNAGSDQKDVFCRQRTVLVGNNPGALGTGKWTVEFAPVGMNPTFSDDTSPRAVVAGMDATGSYKFKWTIKTGDCESSSIVEVITDQDNCKKPKVITNPMTTNKTIRRKK